MDRRFFLSLFPAAAATGFAFNNHTTENPAVSSSAATDIHQYWVNTLCKIVDPVLENLSRGLLKKNMPVEVNPSGTLDRSQVTYLEALGRTLVGIAPWLELGPDATAEGKRRSRYIGLAHKSIAHAVDPKSPDYMQFTGGLHAQALVDAAFLAQAFIRAPQQLWEPLPQEVKRNVVITLKSTRMILPSYNNWLLFMGMIEAFVLRFSEGHDPVRLDYALRKHDEWYKGDGIYGDGPGFHWDYYNSYVIQPMLTDISGVLKHKQIESSISYETVLKRAVRYAVIQERLISPEGTFPVVGRSLAYRFGALQALSQIALLRKLPDTIKPAQVREALTLVIRRMIEAPGTFDQQGWLRIGFVGQQIDMGEYYISTGSLYLCTTGLLAMGLPPNDPFWTDPAAEWTSKKVWGGANFPADHAEP